MGGAPWWLGRRREKMTGTMSTARANRPPTRNRPVLAVLATGPIQFPDGPPTGGSRSWRVARRRASGAGARYLRGIRSGTPFFSLMTRLPPSLHAPLIERPSGLLPEILPASIVVVAWA